LDIFPRVFLDKEEKKQLQAHFDTHFTNTTAVQLLHNTSTIKMCHLDQNPKYKACFDWIETQKQSFDHMLFLYNETLLALRKGYQQNAIDRITAVDRPYWDSSNDYICDFRILNDWFIEQLDRLEKEFQTIKKQTLPNNLIEQAIA